MNTRFPLALAALGSGLFLILGASGCSQDTPAQSQPEGVDVQARGPVHEAFAEPTSTRPEQGQTVTKQPPEPIEEVPPDQKPEGDNVQWIPGYWAWDDEASDFVWVSGCWRDVPPGRRWVPGHWQQLDGGWMWVAGFWGAENLSEIQYLPWPPPTLDRGPSSPPPDANSIYIPGCWVYQTSQYYWQPGYWVAYRPNWVWMPASYIWTPSGCIFVNGYWDYPLDQRGLLFAPVFINQRLFAAARRPFVPRFVVQPDFLLGALFVRQAARHYYFGDYFDPRYQNQGFVAWPDYSPVKGAFDPTFAYYRHQHAADKNWEPALRNLYAARRSGEIPRPPQTLTKQAEAVKTVVADKTSNTTVHKAVNLTHAQNVTALAPLNEVTKSPVTNLAPLGGGKDVKTPARELKLDAVPKESLDREQKAATVMREAAQQRRSAEAKMFEGGKVPVPPTDPANVSKMTWPKLPATIGTPRQPQRTVPPAVTVPKQEQRPIPKYEPPKPVVPPKSVTPPKKGKDD
jgi:hypothetical protein